jgi:hypothetical protein
MAIDAKSAPQVFWTKNAVGLTLIVNGVPAVVDTTNPNFDLIEQELRAGKYDRVLALANVKRTVAEAITNANARVRFVDGELYWEGPKGPEKIAGPLVDRIIASVRNGSTAESIQPLVLLLQNISRNKKKDLREELYQFLMSGKMPITKDGCFLAYKKVARNFKDIYTGTLDNSPGKLVAMDPDKVDVNRHQTCSVGLHFCSRSYLSQYRSDVSSRTVIVKVNPRFVFAIPTDYQNTKGRASEYFVVGEALGDAAKDELFLQPFIFDENMKDAAPQVKFVEQGPEGAKQKARKNVAQPKETVSIGNLKPSLKVLAEGYGLAKNGKAWVRFQDSKGPLPAEKYTIAFEQDGTYISSITGKPVPKSDLKQLSVETKSVRSAMVRAVAKRRGRA